MSKHPSPSGRLRGQTVLVTGTTKGGIGYETARLLGDEGATVLTHGRTPEAARTNVENLVVDGNGTGKFVPVAADLSSIAGARALAEAARAAAPQGINGLVNNAGAGFNERRLSPDGIELTMAINHVAVAALTDALLDLLHAGADSVGRPSRVVSMSALIEGRGKAKPTGPSRASTPRLRPTSTPSWPTCSGSMPWRAGSTDTVSPSTRSAPAA